MIALHLSMALAMQNLPPVLHPMNFEVPPIMGPCDYRRLVALELEGQKNTHVVAGCDDDTLRIMVNPGAIRLIVEAPLATPTHDHDALRADGRAIPQIWDDLVLAQPAGLSIYGWRPAGPFLVPLDHSATYQNCEQVRVRDVNNDGLLDILTVLFGGMEIAIKEQNGSGGFDDAGSITTQGPVQDFDTINFLSIPWGSQVAVNDSEGFEVFKQIVPGGAWVSEDSWPSYRPELDAMTVVKGGYDVPSEPEADQIAFVTARSTSPTNTSQLLMLFDRGGVHLQEIITHEVLGMDSGRCDEDELHDLALTAGVDGHVHFLYAEDDDTDRFTFADSFAVDVGSSDSLAAASPPLIVELNNDGYGSEGDQMLDCVIAYADVFVVDGPLTPDFDDFWGGSFSVDFIVSETCNFPNPASQLVTVNPQCWFDGIEDKKTTWELELVQIHHVKGAAYATPLADSFGYYSLSSISFPEDEVQANFGVLEDLEVPLDGENLNENAHYYTLRLVRRQGGNVVQSGPKLIGCFCLDWETRDDLEVEDWAWPGRILEQVPLCGTGETDRLLGHIRLQRGASLNQLIQEAEQLARLNDFNWDDGQP